MNQGYGISRDEIAVIAMREILANFGRDPLSRRAMNAVAEARKQEVSRVIASEAFDMADAMIAERSRRL